MANMSIDIATGYYESDSLPFANQRCVNLYPNFPQTTAITQSSLFEVQGLEQVGTSSRLAINSNRGSWDFNGIPYFVNGEGLYRLNKRIGFRNEVTYEVEFLGIVDGDTDTVSMADNGEQLIIINKKGVGYIYNPNATPNFSVITDAGFYANGVAKKVVYVDRYFVVTTDAKKAIISAVGDGTDWNSLDFISAEADPDDVIAPFVFRNQLYLLGSETTETYRNVGGAGVPLQRINGFVLSTGCSSPDSVQQLGNQVFWVGNGANEQPVVWRFNGSEPERVSTTAIDNKLHELTEEQLQGIVSWSYSVRGHEFVAFVSNIWCFVFDTITGKWHERESEITLSTGSRVTRPCRIRNVVSAYNDLFCGDSQDGRIGRISENIFKEYGEPLFSYFTTTPLYNLGNSFSIPYVELVCESGVGNSDVSDPQVRLQISRNGVTFENPRTRLLGKVGSYKSRQIWHKNGRMSRIAVFKITISDPVKRRLFALDIKYKQSNNG